MLAPFVIMLREGIEAALIVSIIATYLLKSGQQKWLPAVFVGVFFAVALSLFAGAAILMLNAQFPQKAQELFEALVGLLAVALLVSMVFWMKQAARTMSHQLKTSVDQALTLPGGPLFALIALSFFAVAREGLESIFFLLAIFQQSPGPAAPLSALAGLIFAVLLGVAFYQGGLRINLVRFFRWTGVFIILVAAGLLSSSIRNLHEAGVWNFAQQTVLDLSNILPTSSLLGSILAGLFNYTDVVTAGEAAFYVIFLLGALYFFLRPTQGGHRTPLPPLKKKAS
ncbi:iron uptake transporter permease EfeU [Aestuariivirga sp.]|uniref:iron uptake transporter permease EfeU n=1 Tax=Aestuariivirga sp. TaxID=2650926 RepID=UPI0039E4591C